MAFISGAAQAGSLIQGLELSLLWKNLYNIIILYFVRCPRSVYETWLHNKSVPPTHLIVVSS